MIVTVKVFPQGKLKLQLVQILVVVATNQMRLLMTEVDKGSE